MLNVSNGAWHQVSTQQRWEIYVTVSIIVIKGWGTMKRGGGSSAGSEGALGASRRRLYLLRTRGHHWFPGDDCIVPSYNPHVLWTECYELLNLSSIKQTPGQSVSARLVEFQGQR